MPSWAEADFGAGAHLVWAALAAAVASFAWFAVVNIWRGVPHRVKLLFFEADWSVKAEAEVLSTMTDLSAKQDRDLARLTEELAHFATAIDAAFADLTQRIEALEAESTPASE